MNQQNNLEEKITENTKPNPLEIKKDNLSFFEKAMITTSLTIASFSPFLPEHYNLGAVVTAGMFYIIPIVDNIYNPFNYN